MTLKHRPQIKLPDLSKVSDKGTQAVLEQFMRLFYDTAVNIYDDLNSPIERVDTLPTASAEYVGMLFLKINSGAADTLHICRYNGASLVYEFKTVTVT